MTRRTGSTGRSVAGAVAIAAACALLSAAAPAAKPKMLVQDLVAQGVEPNESAVISSAVCQAFAKAGTHEVLCGEDLRNMMRFSAMSAALDGCQDEKCYATMGRALKARYVVSGTVSKLGSTLVLSLSMFDNETQKAVGRSEVKADTIEKLHLQASEAVSQLRGR